MDNLRLVAAAQWGLAVLDAVPNHVALLDAQGVIVAVNAAWERFALENGLRGGVPACGPGIDYPALCDAARGPSADGAAEAASGIRSVLARSLPIFMLTYPCHSPERQRWFQIMVAPLDVAGAAALVVHTDITARKAVESRLHASEARYRAVVEDQTDVIARASADGKLLFVNEAFCRLHGKTSEELLGTVWRPTVHPDDLDLVSSRLALLAPDDPLVLSETRVLTTNGEVRWMQFAARGFFDGKGRLLELQAVGRDITARHALEDELRNLLDENVRLGRELIRLQEKERAALAKELHDELSQQLVAIRAYAGAIVRRTDGLEDRTRLDAEAIGNAAADIYAISHRLMEGLYPQALDSAGLVGAIAGLASQWSKARPDLEVRLRAAAIGPTSGELRIQLFRIVQECLANAVRHGRPRRIRIFVGERGAGLQRSLRLVVRDDGAGMNLEAPRTGYGLIIMRERARNLGGRMGLRSAPGRGLRVAVEVPLPA